MAPSPFVALPLLALALLGCVAPGATVAPGAVPGGAPSSAHGLVRKGTPEGVDIARARDRGNTRAFTWATWSAETFERARREHKYILLDGAAEWCHWCHVMDETTYADAEVGQILRDRFVTIRVDIDERPDLAERYGAWGWPATIIFSPEAQELGKYRGYLAPDDFKAILHDADQLAPEGAPTPKGPADAAGPVEALGWIAGSTAMQLDAYYDEAEGGWGQRQKAALGAAAEMELRRAAHGDAAARKRALFSLTKQRALLNPVWGGVYQYSAAATWDKPHYEKLMPYQTANLEAYARAYEATKDAAFLADAKGIAGYLSTFLSSADGAFLVSQDADAGAHNPKARFVDGDVYYRLGDAERRKLGVPRVDEHVYGHENGLAISAFCALYEVSRDAAVLARARRAADLVLRTLVAPDGALRRTSGGARYLADAASFGRAVARLAEVSGDAAYRDAAVKLAAAMERDLGDEKTGALWAHTPDPAAAGVFTRREQPFAQNVEAARFLAALARVTGDGAHRDRARKILAAILTPRALTEQGRMVGELLLALDEAGVFPWP